MLQVFWRVCKKAGGMVGEEVGPLSPLLLNCELYLEAITLHVAPRDCLTLLLQALVCTQMETRCCSLPS